MPSPLSSSLTLSSSSSLFFVSSPQLPIPPPKFPQSLFNCHTTASKIGLRLVVRAQAQVATTSDVPRLPVLSFSGEVVGDAVLALRSAPSDTARAVVHRGLIADRQNARKGTASTLTRGEVRGGGKKPYPQKKTGGARRGSQRTPLRPGGGVIFGPKPRDWSIKINRKEKRLAISTALASAARASDALVVDDFDFPEGPRTKEFVAAMRRWGLDPKRKSTFLMIDVPDNVQLSCRNIGTVKVLTPRTLNLFDVLDAEKLIFTRSAIDYLNSVYGDDASLDEEVEDDAEEEGDELLPGDKDGDN